MNKSIVLALIAGAATLTAGVAQAHDASWSVGINLPLPRIVLPAPPVFVGAPVYQPAPVYEEAPVYAPAPVYYQRPPVYVRPVPAVYPRYYAPEWRYHHRDRDHDHDRWEGRGWRRD